MSIRRSDKIKKLTRAFKQGKHHTLSILNGVFGDSLEKNQKNLALKMVLFNSQNPLALTLKALEKNQISRSTRFCILAHGSCGSETGWGFKGNAATDYGLLLQKDFGYTPLYLRYNSGLHISKNGKKLSDMLEKLVQFHPQKISELILVGHSMGGLVFRSACHYGQQENKKWVQLVQKIFYLGSPHLGTHLEKLGKLTTTVLGIIPNPVTRWIGSLGDLRSAGVKDLRHGYITDEDWQQKHSEKLLYWPQKKIPLLKTAQHYLICGTISKVPNSRMGRMFGDGLVHPASGTGRGIFASSALPFLPEHSMIINGISHTRLQGSQRVYNHIKQWCH